MFVFAAGAAVLLGLAGCASRAGVDPATAVGPASSPIATRVAGLEARPGLIDLHVDRAAGKLFAVLPAPSDDGRIGDFLYVEGIVTGLGSNPVGLDRGQVGETQVLRLRALGGKVLFEVQNTGFRALTSDADERRAVEESFADSVIAAAEVVARDADGRLLIDLAGFLVRDAHGIAERLQESGQGSYSLERERSSIDPSAALAFPDNVELEALLTFTSSAPGELVSSVATEPRAISFVQHLSLLRLPDEGYRPREFDPRLGSFAIDFADYATPIGRSIERRWVVRHRLRRNQAGAAERPIVYYVDRGAPSPVREALLEGAGWWAQAFAEAGFPDAFRVELLPEGAHPLDARYNLIQWVHRSTRGWSYGGGVVDPRTGERLKGHVTLGSLRVRQDRLLFEGLIGARGTGSGGADDPVELALARIRQLAAHEVGHALGLAHNFAASTYSGRASVMDYPAPLVRIGADGELDLSRAYSTGVGDWDRHAVRWAYSEFPAGADEAAELEKIARAGLERNFYFLSDADARPAGAAHWRASLWDNGDDPVAALEQTMRARRIALARFGERNVALGAPQALLEETLAPLYFHHRFQLQAAAKLVGGVEYRYTLVGDGGLDQARPVSPERQRRALAALLETLAPAALDLPEDLLRKLLPRPNGYPSNRELFAGRTAPTFDALGAAATAADLSIRALLQPERAARLVDQHRRNETAPDFDEITAALVESAFADTTLLEPRLVELARVVQRVLVDRLLELSANPAAAPWVRSRVDVTLGDLLQRMDKIVAIDGGERAHVAAISSEVGRYLARTYSGAGAHRVAPTEPPGEPIGQSPNSARGALAMDPEWLDGDDGCDFAFFSLTAVVAVVVPAAACADPGTSPAERSPATAQGKPAAPAPIAYRVAASYPHDADAFTQGLIVDGGRLFESTGQYGASSLREVELATGRVLRDVRLAREEFGEGLAMADGRLFQLTWRNGAALVWSPATFARVDTLPLDGEGWGLAFDGRELVSSDGTDRLTFRSPKTFAPTRTVAVTRGGAPQFYLNELDWIDGAIWANVWMSDEIVRIDPSTGRVTGVLDAANLLTAEERDRADVLNGIAWDPAKKLLYVTGKYWPKLFALELR